MPGFYIPGSIKDQDIQEVYLRDIAEKTKRVRNRSGHAAIIFGEKFRRKAGFTHFEFFDGGKDA